MVKNIVFDIGNVILEGVPKNALKYIDIDEDSKEIIETIVFDNPKWHNLDLGIDDFNSYFEKIRKDLPDNIQEISKDVLLKSHEYRKVNQEIIDLIKALSNDYKIYILSDNNANTYNYLKTTELNNYISGWCVSSMYNEVKLNKELYKIFFEVNKLVPSECYFVDDKFENIQIGKEFGMNGFVLNWKENSFSDLIEDMKYNNIKI